MKHMTLDEIRRNADVIPVAELAPAERRRRRLERLAELLERRGAIVTLLSRIEFTPQVERFALRADGSPLTIAYSDPVFREEGLTGDTLGEAMIFFDLSHRQAHHLFCDCHYAGPVRSEMVAERVRSIAGRLTLHEWWNGICQAVIARLR